jgi:SAM-dependent MidA family methyltransferase
MGSSAPVQFPTTPEFAALFRANSEPTARMTFARFMALALYAPQFGYYTRGRQRIGYAPRTDFFTASSSGTIFGELIAAACRNLLSEQNPSSFEFVEIGAETEGGILQDVDHGFGRVRTLQLGAPLELRGRCVVFSNELFDAQPFNRYIRRGKEWREIGVELSETFLTEFEFPASPCPFLPESAPEGYRIDAPIQAAALLNKIAEQPWSGAFLACDYGKSWEEISQATPHGTARAYYRHTQSNDLIARAGEQDITCHICWDWLVENLTARKFTRAKVESQESFFVRHAADIIAASSVANASNYSRRKSALMQLLHPAHLGQKFQVLHAYRSEVD